MAKISNKQLINRLVTAIFVFAVLVLAIVAFFPFTKSWFANNTDVHAKDMRVSAKHAYDTSQTFGAKIVRGFTGVQEDVSLIDGEYLFESLVPGDKIVLYVTLINNEDFSVRGDFFLYDKFSAEAPIIEGEVKYYLSSQLRVNDYKIKRGSDEPDSDEVGDYLFEPEDFGYDSNGAPLSTGTGSELSPPGIFTILEGENLAPGGQVYFETTIEFVKSSVDQNIFKGFGLDDNGYCSRELAIQISPLHD